jgi:HPt (histidine-containing phosphotransfer) domain-containing protein
MILKSITAEQVAERATQPSEISIAAPDAEVVDSAVLESLRELQQEGEPDLISELIDLYLSDTEERLAELHSAMKGKDARVLQRLSHSLKGSSSNLGLLRMATLCAELEKTFGEDVLVDGEALLGRLDEEFALAVNALASEREVVIQ